MRLFDFRLRDGLLGVTGGGGGCCARSAHNLGVVLCCRPTLHDRGGHCCGLISALEQCA